MNKFKNEYTVPMGSEGETKVLLRPTMQALAAVETACGSLSYLAWKFAVGKTTPRQSPTFGDLIKIIFLCQVNRNKDDKDKPEFTEEELFDMGVAVGVFQVHAHVLIFISMVTAGDKYQPEASENAKKNS